MILPSAPVLTRLECISPSTYDASLTCLAKGAWHALGDRATLPEHPAAILGTAFHSTVAAAHAGRLTESGRATRDIARDLFDHDAESLYRRAHPLVKCKFASANRLPYYNLHRERAALHASQIAKAMKDLGSPSGARESAETSARGTEQRLATPDGVIIGRPDHIDLVSRSVLDYKSGIAAADGDAVSEREARQLMLYAHLCRENGTSVTKGVIVRGDGRRCEIDISKSDADAEADRARAQLDVLNRAVAEGKTFEELASPSADNCRMCPCIPFCEAFWEAADSGWVDVCGLHIEGNVAQIARSTVQGFALVTLTVEILRGTFGSDSVSIEQVPERWLTVDETTLPQAGDLLRVVHGRQVGVDDNSRVVRVDKTLTSLWLVTP